MEVLGAAQVCDHQMRGPMPPTGRRGEVQLPMLQGGQSLCSAGAPELHVAPVGRVAAVCGEGKRRGFRNRLFPCRTFW